MIKPPVVFFMDSGVGGLPYLQWIQKEKPLWKLVYLADNACFPYGNKSSEFLIDRLTDITRHIIDLHDPDLIVIACNTASVTALDSLRAVFNKPFVGVVPAVKPAAEVSENGIIGILATEKTVQGKYLEALIKQFAPDQSVETKAASDLVDFVENRFVFTNEKEIYQVLSPYVQYIEKRDWKTVVLGCTHFILLRPWLRNLLPKTVNIIDSTEGVGRRILSLVSIGDEVLTSQPDQCIFHISGKKYNRHLYETVASRYEMLFSPLEEL